MFVQRQLAGEPASQRSSELVSSNEEKKRTTTVENLHLGWNLKPLSADEQYEIEPWLRPCDLRNA